MDVKTIMDTWTLQIGFPVISVERNYMNKTARISQERFLVGKTSTSKESEDSGWGGPITFAAAGDSFENTYIKLWMKQSEKSKEISGMPERETAVVFNVQQTGYYR